MPADLLAGYYHAVHKVTLEYIASVTAEELGRVVDTHWTPPVTASARLVSIVDDARSTSGRPPIFAASPPSVRDLDRRALLLWPAIAVAAMFVLGWGVGRARPRWTTGSTGSGARPARWLLLFTDPWLLAVALAAAVALALSVRRWRLAAVMVASPLVGIVLAALLKHLFRRESGGALAYPSGHITAMVIVMGMLVLVAGSALWAVFSRGSSLVSAWSGSP